MSESLPGMVPSVGVVMISTGHLNGMILLLTIVTCSLAALISGMAPALFAVRADLSVALNEGGRSNG